MIIGIAGQMYSGKNTAGDYLEKKYGFQQRAFAQRVKQAVTTLFDVPLEKADEWKYDGIDGLPLVTVTIRLETKNIEYQLSWRDILRRFGTEVGRELFGEDFWVNQCLPWDTFYQPPKNTKIVITDVRFKNEAERIQELDGKIIRLYRPESDNNDTHASELLEGILPDYRIINDGSINKLYTLLDNVMILMMRS